MLNHAGMEPIHGAINRVAKRVDPVYRMRDQRGTLPRSPGTDRQPSQSSSSCDPSGVITGLSKTVGGTIGRSG